MTLHFPVWLAYVSVCLGCILALWGIAWMLCIAWTWFVEHVVRALRLNKAIIDFATDQRRGIYIEDAEYRQKYADLLKKTSPASGECLYTSDQETLRRLTEQLIAWAEALDAFENAEAQEDAAPSEGFISAHRAMKQAEELYTKHRKRYGLQLMPLKGGLL